jgi:putative ATPase
VLTLAPLTDDDVRDLLRRAVADRRGLDGSVELSEEAEEHLLRVAGGDARRALTSLEAAAGAALDAGSNMVDLTAVERAVDKAAPRYDRDGDQHYDVISAFIKSCRGSDVDAALHYLARMLEAGEDPRFIARRLIILASEDVGLADPTALQTAVAAAQAVQLIGLPEGRLTLAQATVAIALAPKSNAVTTAIGAAEADVRRGLIGPVPAHLRDSHYSRAADLGHGVGYVYPHDLPGGVAPQQYGPDQLGDRSYYQPTRHGAEARYADVLERLRVALGRGAAKPQETGPDSPVGSETPTPGEES